MENQPTFRPQNQDNQEPSPQELNSITSSTPAQSSPTVFVSDLHVSGAQPSGQVGGGRRSPVEFIVIAIIVICVLAAGAYLLITHNDKAAKIATHAVVQNKQPSPNTSAASSSSSEKNIAFGSTAADGTFQVKLLRVIPTPTVIGDLPDPGTEYIEADFSVTSVANRNNYAFNMQFLPSSIPAGKKIGNIEFTPVDSTSPISPLTFSTMPTKKVQIAGKVSTESDSLPIDGTAQILELYTLFEVKQGDKGQIVWQGLDGGSYHFLTQ